MNDDKRQDSQKTVVAFVAGLLIGGLLVWVFSSSPETAVPVPAADETSDVTAQDDVVAADSTDDEMVSEQDAPTTDETVATPVTVGAFKVTVSDQPAGTSVALSNTASYPTNDGWVAVHEIVGGNLGNALGAARYSVSEGLMPSVVELLRSTTSGETYMVVYHSDDGDRVFNLSKDTPVRTADGALIATTFVAG